MSHASVRVAQGRFIDGAGFETSSITIKVNTHFQFLSSDEISINNEYGKLHMSKSSLKLVQLLFEDGSMWKIS